MTDPEGDIVKDYRGERYVLPKPVPTERCPRCGGRWCRWTNQFLHKYWCPNPMNTRATEPVDRKDDPKLEALYVELDGVEIAMDNAFFVVEWNDLNKRRAELLGLIKERERCGK